MSTLRSVIRSSAVLGRVVAANASCTPRAASFAAASAFQPLAAFHIGARQIATWNNVGSNSKSVGNNGGVLAAYRASSLPAVWSNNKSSSVRAFSESAAAKADHHQHEPAANKSSVLPEFTPEIREAAARYVPGPTGPLNFPFWARSQLVIRSSQFSPHRKFVFWLFVSNFIVLGYIGGCVAEYPFVQVGQIASFAYFILLFLFWAL